MKTYLFDSDVVIWFFKGRDKEVELLNTLSAKGRLLISAVTVIEVRTGISRQAETVIKNLKNLFDVVVIDVRVAEQAGAYKQKYGLGIADMLIAASTKISNSTLVTYNKKHYPMRDIKLYDSSE